MILRSLKLKNVKCYDTIKVDFETGKNLIIGKNGSGKSAIVQSILYSLYSIYEQGNNDEIVRTGEDVARFDLDFEQDGKEYHVHRKIQGKKT